MHYGIVIDCGSSGSRLYIYVWPEHSGRENELLQIKQLLDSSGRPVVKKLEPGFTWVFIYWKKNEVIFISLGLSSMADTPENATEYLKTLLGELLCCRNWWFIHEFIQILLQQLCHQINIVTLHVCVSWVDDLMILIFFVI